MTDGRCPACNEVLEGGDGLFTKVTVFQRGPSGGFCMKCGTPTSETARIRKKARNDNYRPNSTSSLENHPLALLLNFFGGKFHQTVEVTVPLCEGCKSGELNEPKYVDFEARSMTFVGHRAWKEDIERARRAKKDA